METGRESIDRTGVVVGYDGSLDADLALAWAARTAALEHRTVTTVMVDDVDVSPWSTHGWQPDDEHAERVGAVLREAGVEGTSERVSGHPAAVLVVAARDAALLVVGSQGRGRVAEALVGSVGQHVARHAECPVTVVREPAHAGAARIVVGVDGSGGSAAALEHACRRAELTGEPVVALHAWKTGELLVDRQGLLPASVGAQAEERERLLAESVAGVAEAHPDVVLTREAVPVAPSRALVDASATASLVVVGSRGRGGFAGLLLGSVSHDVVARARCPVAVVR